jgi:hypothetical protein
MTTHETDQPGETEPVDRDDLDATDDLGDTEGEPGEAIPLGQGSAADITFVDDLDAEDDEDDTGTTDEPAAADEARALDDVEDDAEPVIVELDETDVGVLDADESVLLNEEEGDAALEVEDAEPLPVPEASAAASLEPAGVETLLDPGGGTYRERWSAIQGSFVDEPMRAVESAGSLVAQVWHELERSFAEQRDALDDGWDTESSTDDLRAAFQAYRALFIRLTDLLSK